MVLFGSACMVRVFVSMNDGDADAWNLFGTHLIHTRFVMMFYDACTAYMMLACTCVWLFIGNFHNNYHQLYHPARYHHPSVLGFACYGGGKLFLQEVGFLFSHPSYEVGSLTWWKYVRKKDFPQKIVCLLNFTYLNILTNITSQHFNF